MVESYQRLNGCQVRMVGESLYTAPVFMMLKRELVDGFNLALQFALSQGTSSLLAKQWQGFYYASRTVMVRDPSVCQDEYTIHQDTAASLNIYDMAGIYSLVVMSTLLCLAVEIPRRVWQRQEPVSAGAPPLQMQLSGRRIVMPLEHVHLLPPACCGRCRRTQRPMSRLPWCPTRSRGTI
mmetsp:Transcript_24447/g.67968  ORF Transcript_24447/g.67968 Transcript_24447/m.67968 type:complete len:180 (+) Transcript_24447:1864-2403(+)